MYMYTPNTPLTHTSKRPICTPIYALKTTYNLLKQAAFKKGGCTLMTWAELMELGAKVSDEELDDRQVC